MDYFDILLAKKLEDDRDPKVEGLSVSANGRYHEDGVVYDPVIVALPLDSKTITSNGTYKASDDNLEGYNEVEVDVPLPSNAYLLKDIENTPSAIATFTDGANLPMPKLEVAIEPQQDLHGYDAPWVGGAGKNKLDSAYFSGVSQYTVNSNQSVTITANDTRNWTGVTTYPMKAGTYVFSRSGTSGACAIRTSLDDYASDFVTIISGYTSASYTLSSDCNIKIKLDYNSGSYPITEKIQIESGNQATAWQPYSNICPISGWSAVDVTVADDVDNPTTTKTITIQLGDTYYGGKLDVVSGVLTVDRANVDLGDLTWTYSSSNGRSLFTSSDITDYKHTGSNDIAVNAISECFVNIPMSAIFKNGQMGMDGVEERNRIIICDNRYTDATSFKTAMNGVQLVYELATPTTIQLTPTLVKTLQGINNVFADCGNILDLSYFGKEE